MSHGREYRPGKSSLSNAEHAATPTVAPGKATRTAPPARHATRSIARAADAASRMRIGVDLWFRDRQAPHQGLIAKRVQGVRVWDGRIDLSQLSFIGP
jgi:hypothetical protein